MAGKALHEFSRIITNSKQETFIFLEDGFYFGEKIGLDENFVGALVGPGADEAGFVAVAEPVGDLFDAGLLQRVGKRGLASVWCVAGEDVAAGVRHPRKRG